MTKIHHINCGTLIVQGYPTVVCHCLLLESKQGLLLVDAGIGLLDVQNPVERLGQELIDMAGFQFNESDTAVRRIEALGFSVADVRHIVLTHCDPDHTGGLADFPNAQVHVAQEELQHMQSGHWRYVNSHFEHGPNCQTYSRGERDWFGLQARPINVDPAAEVLLIPLFGHTIGHCGVAIRQDSRWLLHAGDAYYLRAELTDDNHPVSSFAAQRADDNDLRQSSLKELRRLFTSHTDEIEMIGYHDINELPQFPAATA
ncbi:MBL fold metallo-hydrolase [Gimesia aquarii]|uniref:N-acyl homoserine lactonase n=1 Tax=Gimesia aquarii TaxID=2527964 RepID=A0A517W4N5_9PLAN|nr:MBL fold metallo-hydrolase [Gimesia aquarii]QDU00204.1 N-acyl homoserine lactonase [Gimesia aquarii]